MDESLKAEFALMLLKEMKPCMSPVSNYMTWCDAQCCNVGASAELILVQKQFSRHQRFSARHFLSQLARKHAAE